MPPPGPIVWLLLMTVSVIVEIRAGGLGGRLMPSNDIAPPSPAVFPLIVLPVIVSVPIGPGAALKWVFEIPPPSVPGPIRRLSAMLLLAIVRLPALRMPPPWAG